MQKRASTYAFVALILLFAILTAISVFLPQGIAGMPVEPVQMPAPIGVVALIAGAGVLLVYGVLGTIGFLCARKLGLPEIWDATISNRQRFLMPALAGIALGVLVVLLDLVFTPINGIGRIPHPPFPTSIVAALAAGIGEEVLFRLFFISFWTWLISGVLLRGRSQDMIFWVVSVVSALAFAFSHLPALMYLQSWIEISQVPPSLFMEIVIINGLMGLTAAYFFKKFGFLAAVGIHFWADVVWHVIWGLL